MTIVVLRLDDDFDLKHVFRAIQSRLAVFVRPPQLLMRVRSRISVELSVAAAAACLVVQNSKIIEIMSEANSALEFTRALAARRRTCAASPHRYYMALVHDYMERGLYRSFSVCTRHMIHSIVVLDYAMIRTYLSI